MKKKNQKNQEKAAKVVNPNEINFQEASLENLYTALGTGKLTPENKSRVLELIAIKQSESDRRVMEQAVMSEDQKIRNRVNALKMDFHKVLNGFVNANKVELCKAKTILAKTAEGSEKGSWSAFSISEPVKVGTESLNFQIVCQVSNQKITKRLYKKLKFDAQQALLAEKRQKAIEDAWSAE